MHYCQNNKERLQKKAHERCWTLFEKEKEKKRRYGHEQYKEIPKDEKQKTVKYRKKYYKMREKTLYYRYKNYSNYIHIIVIKKICNCFKAKYQNVYFGKAI